MKKLLFVAMMALFTMPVVAQENSGDIKTETRTIGPYDKIRTSKGINVTLVEGTSEKVEINVKNASPEEVITSLEGKTLVLKMKTMIRKGVAVQVYVTYKSLIGLEANSGSTIDNDGTLTASKLNISVGADAVMELDLDVNNLIASLTAGRMEISGTAANIEVTANTGGKFNAPALENKEAFIKATSGASALVRPTVRLSANAVSGGKILYYGTPRVEKAESLGGKVEPAE